MAKPQLLYGAYDTGPSNYGLDVVSYAQRKLNWGIKYVGNNATYADVYGMNFDYAIVGGPSSFENTLDAAMLTASLVKKKPVYVLGDSPRSILRPGVKKYVHQAIAIVASPFDIPLAKEFGYKDAVWLGYPSHWGNPTTTKPSRLFEYDDVAVHVFVCGLKEAEITDAMLASVVHAMNLRGGDDWCVYFQAHPSEIAATQNPDRRANLLAHPRVRELKTRENVASIMMAANLTVCTGGATAVLDGALLRLPVIYYLDNKVMDYMKKQVNEDLWGPVDAGACQIAEPDTMTTALRLLLDISATGNDFCEHLRLRQEAAFPAQPAGMNTVAEVLSYIQDPAGYVPFDAREVK